LTAFAFLHISSFLISQLISCFPLYFHKRIVDNLHNLIILKHLILVTNKNNLNPEISLKTSQGILYFKKHKLFWVKQVYPIIHIYISKSTFNLWRHMVYSDSRIELRMPVGRKLSSFWCCSTDGHFVYFWCSSRDGHFNSIVIPSEMRLLIVTLSVRDFVSY
jgi:hypothetical protein